MKRPLLPLLLLLAAPAWAANVYIDSGCPDGGDGTTDVCDGSNAGNPYDRIEDWINAGEACNTTVYVRGIHAAHGSCAGVTSGRYHGNEWAIDVNGCGAGTPIIVQPYNYSGLGTGEVVYLDGTRCPHPSGCANCGYAACEGQDAVGEAWAQCDWDGSACDCDTNGQNVTIGAGGSTACEETWFTSDDGTAGTGFQGGSASRVLWAQKDDGSLTYRAGGANLTAALADMTNSHSGYVSARCTNPNDAAQTYQPCFTSADCTRGGTCTATSPEVDSLRTVQNDECTAGSTPYPCCTGSGTGTCPTILYVRWGSSVPTRPYVVYDGSGDAFALKPASDYVTIRGFVLRAHRGPVIWLDEGSTNHTIQDNLFIYSRTIHQYNNGSSGDAYGIVGYGAKTHSILDNEISFTNDEGIHAQGFNSGSAPSVYLIKRNYIHHTGWQDIDGAHAGTGSGILIGGTQPIAGSDDFTGSELSNNVLAYNCKIGAGGTTCNGIRMENFVSNVVVRDNIVRASKNACLTLDGSDGPSNANQIFNNVLQDCGGDGIEVHCLDDSAATESVEDNAIYNNTVVNPVGAGLSLSFESAANCGGAGDENLIRNNIFSTTGSQAMVSWTDTEANTFTNNLIHTTHATPVNWLNVGYTCANVNAGCSGNCPSSLCGTGASYPVFVSSTDFHIQTTSPAKDAGTATGMPSGRTTDIANTLASLHGLPNYSDANAIQGGTWDIGADEFVAASGTRRPMVISELVCR